MHETASENRPEDGRLSPTPIGPQTAAGIPPESVVEFLEQQLRRVAFSLHDGPIQTLTATGSMLQRTDSTESVESIRAQVAAAQGLLDYAVTEIRELMQEASPSELETSSLVATLSELADRTRQHWGIPVDLTVSGTEAALPQHVQVSFFRVAQEALTNVRKHAKATCVRLELAYASQSVECNVIDDGTGFDQDRAAAIGAIAHWGLGNMRERMRLIGGVLDIESEPGVGTRIRARLPLVDR